ANQKVVAGAAEQKRVHVDSFVDPDSVVASQSVDDDLADVSLAEDAESSFVVLDNELPVSPVLDFNSIVAGAAVDDQCRANEMSGGSTFGGNLELVDDLRYPANDSGRIGIQFGFGVGRDPVSRHGELLLVGVDVELGPAVDVRGHVQPLEQLHVGQRVGRGTQLVVAQRSELGV